MATVLGEVELTFANSTVYTVTVERAVEPDVFSVEIFRLVLDVPYLVAQWGPVTSLEVSASFTAIPLPPSVWALATALAWLWMRARQSSV